jgi:hypothetical protein
MSDGRVDAAIDGLDDALDAAGFVRLTQARDPELLAGLARDLAPYALPADLRRFWERFELASLRVRGWQMPELLDPGAALLIHRQNLEEAPLLFGPPLLFPLARISGDQWSIELASAHCAGGIVVSHGDVGPITVEYPSFLDLVEVYAELLEEGRFESRSEGHATFGREDERQKQELRLAAAWPHPVYGGSREFASRPAEWPAHWLEAAGLDLREREPLGATHTIAELVEASRRGALEARIRGEVVRLAGSPSGRTVLVSDGGRSLAVFCPAAVTTWGPVLGGSYEFELTLHGDGDEATAVAAAVRPLD